MDEFTALDINLTPSDIAAGLALVEMAQQIRKKQSGELFYKPDSRPLYDKLSPSFHGEGELEQFGQFETEASMTGGYGGRVHEHKHELETEKRGRRAEAESVESGGGLRVHSERVSDNSNPNTPW